MKKLIATALGIISISLVAVLSATAETGHRYIWYISGEWPGYKEKLWVKFQDGSFDRTNLQHVLVQQLDNGYIYSVGYRKQVAALCILSKNNCRRISRQNADEYAAKFPPLR